MSLNLVRADVGSRAGGLLVMLSPLPLAGCSLDRLACLGFADVVAFVDGNGAFLASPPGLLEAMIAGRLGGTCAAGPGTRCRGFRRPLAGLVLPSLDPSAPGPAKARLLAFVRGLETVLVAFIGAFDLPADGIGLLVDTVDQPPMAILFDRAEVDEAAARVQLAARSLLPGLVPVLVLDGVIAALCWLNPRPARPAPALPS